jgi:hypothetical protein
MKGIIDYLKSKANYEDFDLFRARNLTDSAIWSDYNISQKSIIEQLLYAVYVAYHNGQDSADVHFSIPDVPSVCYLFLFSPCPICIVLLQLDIQRRFLLIATYH